MEERMICLSSEYRSGESYLQALGEKGYKVLSYTGNFLRHFTHIPREKLRLKHVSVEGLGLPKGGTAELILAAAKTQGLRLCPAWVGPQYRMACGDGAYVAIGTKPLIDPFGNGRIFYVYHTMNSGRWLHSRPTDYHWNAVREWGCLSLLSNS